VAPVPRAVPETAGVLQASLEALLAGPNAAERAAGLSSVFSGDTAGMLRGVSLEGRRAVVDVDAAPVGAVRSPQEGELTPLVSGSLRFRTGVGSPVRSAAVRRPARLLATLLVLATVGACAGDDPTVGEREASSPTTVRPVGPVHPLVSEFLEEAEAGVDAAFTGTYSTLRKLGSLEATAEVAQDPPAASIAVDDLVVVTGPDPATCRVSAGACTEDVREDRLGGYGLFSGFYSTGPSLALGALAERPEAGEPELSEREVAGVTLRCIALPVQGVVANTSCITSEGVYGFVDNAAQRFELTAYSPEAPETPPAPPFPVTDDTSFLAD
jgi:hypothetical protein